MNVFFNDRILPMEEARISPEDRGFLFADGVYEVVLALDGGLVFWDEHHRRLLYGLRELGIAEPTLNLRKIAEDLLAANAGDEGRAIVYLQITRGAAPRSHRYPPAGTSPTVYGYAKVAPDIALQTEEGFGVLSLDDVRWSRCDIKSIGLLANSMAYEQAHSEGAKEAVFVREGRIVEGAHTNVFLVMGGELHTPPEGRVMLSGVTRRAVIDLARGLGLPVCERVVPADEVSAADEVFVTGTTSDVTPVVRWDGRAVGEGSPGPVTRQIQNAYRELLRSSVQSLAGL